MLNDCVIDKSSDMLYTVYSIYYQKNLKKISPFASKSKPRNVSSSVVHKLHAALLWMEPWKPNLAREPVHKCRAPTRGMH